MIVCERLIVTALGQIEQASLQLKPSVRPHFLGGQFVLRPSIKIIGTGVLTHARYEISNAREAVPS